MSVVRSIERLRSDLFGVLDADGTNSAALRLPSVSG